VILFYFWWFLALLGIAFIWWKKPSIPVNQKKFISYRDSPKKWIISMSIISLLIVYFFVVDGMLRLR